MKFLRSITLPCLGWLYASEFFLLVNSEQIHNLGKIQGKQRLLGKTSKPTKPQRIIIFNLSMSELICVRIFLLQIDLSDGQSDHDQDILFLVKVSHHWLLSKPLLYSCSNLLASVWSLGQWIAWIMQLPLIQEYMGKCYCLEVHEHIYIKTDSVIWFYEKTILVALLFFAILSRVGVEPHPRVLKEYSLLFVQGYSSWLWRESCPSINFILSNRCMQGKNFLHIQSCHILPKFLFSFTIPL